MPNKTFLDSAGLSTFLTNLKSAYAGNDTNAFSTFTVAKAGKADQLATARTVTFATGDVTGSFSFDGSANVSDVVLSVADAVASTSGAGGSHGLMTAAQAEKLSGIADGPAGTRFRVMTTTTDPVGATKNITGISLCRRDNPAAGFTWTTNETPNRIYTAPSDCFLLIQKDNTYNDAIKTYVIDATYLDNPGSPTWVTNE